MSTNVFQRQPNPLNQALSTTRMRVTWSGFYTQPFTYVSDCQSKQFYKNISEAWAVVLVYISPTTIVTIPLNNFAPITALIMLWKHVIYILNILLGDNTGQKKQTNKQNEQINKTNKNKQATENHQIALQSRSLLS